MEFSNEDKWLSDNDESAEEEDQQNDVDEMNDETEEMVLNPVSVRQRIDVSNIQNIIV